MPGFNCVAPDEYRRLYMDQLARLDPRKVLHELSEVAGGLVPALLCFEPPPPNTAWCHRGLVSVWLQETLGLHVIEFGHPEKGSGWRHPKLPEDWQNAAAE